MVDVLQLKQHDTKPDFRAQLLNGATPVDLSTADSVKFLMRQGAVLISGPMVIEQGQAGWVRRVWGDHDLDTEGSFRFEVEVTWGDDTVQTFPPKGYAEGYIHRDLG